VERNWGEAKTDTRLEKTWRERTAPAMVSFMRGDFRVFHSFAESERADRAYYRSLTPSQRLDLLLELIQQWQGDETAKGFERVYRVVELHES
jgi:hypothetical protein